MRISGPRRSARGAACGCIGYYTHSHIAYVCVCACNVYVYTHTYIAYVCVYGYNVYVYTHTYAMCECVCVCGYNVYVHTHTYARTHKCIQVQSGDTQTQRHRDTETDIKTQRHTDMDTETRTQTQTQTQTQTHRPACRRITSSCTVRDLRRTTSRVERCAVITRCRCTHP